MAAGSVSHGCWVLHYGMFFVFEGIDGSGKSTQAALFVEHLRAHQPRPVLLVREPGGTELSERVRELVLESTESLSAPTELFLFMAARSHLVETRVRPALERGEIVVSDRFVWSSVAYQGWAGGVPQAEILRMGRLAVGDLRVHRTFVIDVDPAVAHARATDANRMEGRGLKFQERVRAGFLALAAERGEEAAVIDGDGTPDVVLQRVLGALPEASTW